MNCRRFITLVIVGSPVAIVLAQGTTHRSAQTNLVPLSISPPDEVKSRKVVGPMHDGETIHFSVSLAPRDPEALERFVDSVSSPSSPSYRHFISPIEVGNRFGASKADLQSIIAYLQRNGIQIRLVANNRLTVLADATIGQAAKAFHTSFVEYAATPGEFARGRKAYSFTHSLALPAQIASKVLSINGLENLNRPKPKFVTPTQLQTLYNLTPLKKLGNNGEGRSVGISNWDGFRLSNVPHEYAQFFLPKPAGGVGSNIKVVTVSGGAGTGQAEGEGDLDIQAVLGVAPLCNLTIYDGGDVDLIGVLTREANDNAVDVITESYGWKLNPATTRAAHALHLAMSAQGITYIAASGDEGTSLGPYIYPSNDPEVLIVGGTTVQTDVKGNRKSEIGWDGSGGGWSIVLHPFNKLPAWQTGKGIPKNIPFRLIPDVALDADPKTGYVVCYGGSFTVFGGTSGSSPTFAGGLAVSQQQLVTNGWLKPDANGHTRMGRIQDLIYKFNGDATVFYDVKLGQNGYLPDGKLSAATAGWDFVTGLGVINFNGFVTKVSSTIRR